MSKETILITAALPYINNVPHMGHIVGSHLPADIFYRYCKLKGHDVTFIGGSDEYGTPSMIAAKELGLNPKQLTDSLHEIHKKVYEKLSINYTNYSRTSSATHHKTVIDFFNSVKQKGFVKSDIVKMYFCENDKIYLPDRFVSGTCPKCNYESANGDQCESCLTNLTQTDLINPHCKSCGSTPSMKTSDHLLFELDKLSKSIDNWVDSKQDIWRPHVYSEAKKWIKEGLKSRSITRDLNWGIKVPNDAIDDKVFYVWFDALLGYMSFTKELGTDIYEKYWTQPNSKIFHFLGKDNIPFHTIFWPGMLLAHDNLNLPTNIVGYNYLNFEGNKFSKSKGIGVFCYNLLDSDIDIDTLRSYLTTIIPENKDSDFKWTNYKTNTNGDLIGKLGNFFNRTIHMLNKNFNGHLDNINLTNLDDADLQIINSIKTTPEQISKAYSKTEFRDAHKQIINFASIGNAYFDRKSPWKLINENNLEETKKTLYLSLSLCKSLAIVATPILPNSMQKFWSEQLNLSGLIMSDIPWEESEQITFLSNHKTNPPKPLFNKIDDLQLKTLETHFSTQHSLKDLQK